MDKHTEIANESDAAAIIEHAHDLARIDEVVAGKVVGVPTSRKLESLKPLLDQYLARPERRVGVQVVHELPSFIAWTKRHADPASVLFCDADRKTPSLVSVIDYHLAGPATQEATLIGAENNLARWRRFGAAYPMPFDERWLAWRALSGQPVGQAEFAAFLEDHALDLCPFAATLEAATDQLKPLPSDVLDFLRLTGGKCGTPDEVIALAGGLDVAVGQSLREASRLQSGERKLAFEEKHETTKDGTVVMVPPIFLIAVPVFRLSDAAYRIPVRLRYRPTPGGVVWIPTLWRADETVDQAIRDSAGQAAIDTALPLFYGASPFKSGGAV